MTSPSKTALITGATGGIGRALAGALAPHYHLILAGRDKERLAELAAAFPGAQTLHLDLSRPGALASTLSVPASLDAVIHNAGVVQLGDLARTSVSVWQDTLNVNVVSAAELTRLTLPALRLARGHVILINSGAGLSAHAGWGSYAASKFALRAFADALRAEEASSGVRVTTVYPGRTATEMQRRVRGQEGGEYSPERYIQPGSVAAAVLGALLLPRDAVMTEVTVRPGV